MELQKIRRKEGKQYRTRIESNCKVCNKKFMARTDSKDHIQIYCSRKCQAQVQAMKNLEAIHKKRIGKTLEELYGKDKANQIKNSQSKSKLTKPTKYWSGKERSKEVKEALSKSKKGKHWEQIFKDPSKVREAKEKNREQRMNIVYPLIDTKIEKKIQDQLKEKGIKFETHKKILGKPDIYIPDLKLAIFADGCFHHACPECKLVQDIDSPLNNSARNQYHKDMRIKHELELEGHNVIRLYGHEINKPDFDIEYFIDRHHNINR